MTDFPTVGLEVDLTGIGKGEKAYDNLAKTIDRVAVSADKAGKVVGTASRKAKAADDQAVQGSKKRATEAEKAAAAEVRAEAKKARALEQQRRYLQQVRIKSIQMEEAARRVAQMEEARAAARQAREMERAARQAAAAQVKAQREVSRERIRMAAEQARRDRAEAAEQERLTRYLQRVKLTSLRWEEAERKRVAMEELRVVKATEQEKLRLAKDAERERTRLARQEAQARASAERAARVRSVGGSGGIGGGGGSGGGGFGSGPDDANAFMRVLGGLRNSLRETRRLIFDVRTAIGVFLGAMVITPIVHMADAMTALRARVAAFADEANDVPYMMEAIYAAAQRARTPLDAMATLYTRLIPLADQLGKSQVQILRISETIAKGIQIGGSTAAETASASQQLAQALASNRLGGDELRSLAENAPLLLAKIAKALNMNTAQFIKWAHEGKANAAIVVGALETATAEIDAMFAAFPVTIGQSITLVGNAFSNLVGKVNEATGASTAIAGVIAQFAALLESERAIQAVSSALTALGKVLGFVGDAIGVLVASWPLLLTLLAGMAGAKMMAAIASWGALTKAIAMYGVVAQGVGRGAAALIVAQSALGVATAGVVRGFGALVSMLGGPVGVALIGVAAGYSYVRANTMSAQEAQEKYDGALRTGSGAIDRAITFMDAYGASTKEFTDILLEMNGLQEDQVRGLDEAGRAAVARAANERALTVSLLERAAAEGEAAAAGMRRSIVLDRIAAGYHKFTADIAPVGSAARAQRQARADNATNRGNLKQSLVDNTTKNVANLRTLAQATAKLDVSGAGIAPTSAGPPGPTPPAKAKRAAADPRDMTAERDADVARLIAQAMQDELRARLDLAVEIEDRADLEAQLARAEYAERIAQIDRQIENIKEDELNTNKAAQIQALEGIKLQEEMTQHRKQQLAQQLKWREVSQRELDRKQDIADNEIELMEKAAELLESDYARAMAQKEIVARRYDAEREQLEGQRDMVLATKDEIEKAERRLAILDQLEAEELKQLDRQTTLSDLIGEAADAVRGFKNAFKSGNWSGLVREFRRTVELIGSSFDPAQGGSTGQGMMTLGSMAATAIGGKTGRIAGTSLGMAGAGLGIGAFAGTAAGATALGTIGLGAMATTIAAFAGPIAVAAAALYAAVKIFNVGGKPSNKGAGYDLVTGRFSGDKRSEETEEAVKSAADAIAGAQAMLEASGIKLGATVNGLVLGTRDLTQIYLSNGQTLTSAVGDAAAATDAGIRGMLEGATYVSTTQKELVESMLAAGRGFDEITEKLQAYAAAQGILTSVNDEIQRLRDPKAYDLSMLERGQTARRTEVKTAFDAGYLTADQFAEINTQLKVLEGLETDEVLRRYTDAMEDLVDTAGDLADRMSRASDLENELRRARGDEAGAVAAERAQIMASLHPALRGLQQAVWDQIDANERLALADQGVADARNALTEAAERETSALQATIDKFQALADTLRDFRESLSLGAISENPTVRYGAAAADFKRVAALAASGDTAAMEELQRVGEQFIQASEGGAKTQLEHLKNIILVRESVRAAEAYANAQVSVAQAQLTALNTQIAVLMGINTGVLSVAQAIANLQTALAIQKAAQEAAKPPTQPAAAGYAGYVDGNNDILAAYEAYGRARGQSKAEFGKQHWLSTGYMEGRGVVPFAKGGVFDRGIVSSPTLFNMGLMGEAGAESIMPLTQMPDGSMGVRAATNDNGEVVAELRQVNHRLGTVEAQMVGVAKSNSSMERIVRRWDGEGMPQEREPAE